MATTELEEPEPTRADRIAEILGRTASEVTGTGPLVPLRVFILLITAGVCLTLAPFPASAIGIAALVFLALWIAARRGLK